MIKYMMKKVVLCWKMKTRKKRVQILNVEESLKLVKESRKSLCRFGDGELCMIYGAGIGFQHQNHKLSVRLKEILSSTPKDCIIAVPDTINHYKNLTRESYRYWVSYMYHWRDSWLRFLSSDYTYCSANLTRLYYRSKDKSKCEYYFRLMKEIWENRELVIVEGSQTRLGVGNDLFKQALSIERIICPSTNAFDQYDEILGALNKIDKHKLIIIALGPTASVLAYDLSKLGYCALDVGHCDIEYEWYLAGANKKIRIKGKYTNEAGAQNKIDHCSDPEYLKQIRFNLESAC